MNFGHSFLFQVGGSLFVSYNLGTQDIAVGEMNVRINDGVYHVVRFTRSGANATLQVDDFQVQRKHPKAPSQLTVFNSQSQIQIGGRWNPTLRRVDRPFVGVLAGLVYNGLRPLDHAADSDERTKILVRIPKSAFYLHDISCQDSVWQ